MLNHFTILAAIVWLIPLSQVLPYLVGCLVQRADVGRWFGLYLSSPDALRSELKTGCLMHDTMSTSVHDDGMRGVVVDATATGAPTLPRSGPTA
jgi:hypothetical protein